jgi:hypothetical protein
MRHALLLILVLLLLPLTACTITGNSIQCTGVSLRLEDACFSADDVRFIIRNDGITEISAMQALVVSDYNFTVSLNSPIAVGEESYRIIPVKPLPEGMARIVIMPAVGGDYCPFSVETDVVKCEP